MQPPASQHRHTPYGVVLAVWMLVLTLTGCGGGGSSGPPAPTTYGLKISLSGSGRVVSAPVGIDCGPTCSAQYAAGTAVTLTPTPQSGWSFAGWSGACSGTGTCTVGMSGETSVGATFTAIPTPVPHALKVNLTGSGSVVSAPTGIDCGATCTAQFAEGTSVTLTATPLSGWTFSGWTGDCTGTATCTLSMTADRTVGATFTARPTPAPASHTLKVSLTGSGSVMSNPAGISCGASCTASFVEGTGVTLTATPQSGWTFSGWSGDCTGSTPCTVNMEADRTVAAVFTAVPTPAPTQHALKVNLTGNGRVLSTPSGIDCGSACTAQFSEGTAVTLTPSAQSGWAFSGWSGACSGTGTCALSLDIDKAVTATFAVVPAPMPAFALIPLYQNSAYFVAQGATALYEAQVTNRTGGFTAAANAFDSFTAEGSIVGTGAGKVRLEYRKDLSGQDLMDFIVVADAAVPVGSYTVKLTARSGSTTSSTDVKLEVTPCSFGCN